MSTPFKTALQYNLCFNADYGTENFDKAFVNLRVLTPTGKTFLSSDGTQKPEYREFSVQLTGYLSADEAKVELKRFQSLQSDLIPSYGCNDAIVWR
jgi:hypothetical protein